MNELICIAYPDEQRAAEVLSTLRQLQHEHLIDLEDAVIVTKDAGGEINIHQTSTHSGAGTAGIAAGTVGFLVGALFFAPLASVAMGAAAGLVARNFAEHDMDDSFLDEVGSLMMPGSSALFVLVRRSSPEQVLPEISRYGGTVLRTTLAPDAAARLQDALTTPATGEVARAQPAIPVDARVSYLDAGVETRNRALVDPLTGTMTHLIVTDDQSLAIAREHLGIAPQAPNGDHVLPVEQADSPEAHGATILSEEDLVDCVGARLESTDGFLAHVNAVLLGVTDAHATHLVVRQGHWMGARVIAIPIADIAQVEDGTVYLTVDNEAVNELITIPVKEWNA